MKCPIDATELVMSERSGVEIDYCPQCRGIWLDRGELDKIIDRASSELRPDPRDRSDSSGRERDYASDRDRHERPARRRKESFLGELFDF